MNTFNSKSGIGRILSVCTGLLLLGTFHTGAQEQPRSQVLLVTLQTEGARPVAITEDVAAYIERAADKAQAIRADYVIIELSADRGKIDSAIRVVEAIEKRVFPVPTAVFVTGRAWDAGALVALAGDKLFMKPSATIGGTKDIRLPGKLKAAWAAQFREVAVKRGRDPVLAQAIADRDLQVSEALLGDRTVYLTPAALADEQRKSDQGLVTGFRHVGVVSPQGEPLMAGANDAVNRFGLADGVANSTQDVLDNLGLSDACIAQVKMSWLEKLAKIVAHPAVRTLLAMLGLLGIFFEFKLPGAVVPGALGLACFILLFLGHKIVGLAGYLEIFLFILGVAMLAIEIFFIPGFGFFGVAGIFTILLSLFMSFTHSVIPRAPWEMSRWEGAVLTVLLVFVGTMALGVLLALYVSRFLHRTPYLNRLILADAVQGRAGPVVAVTPDGQPLAAPLNAYGTALTPLRPAGKARIDGKVYDVVSEGEWVAASERVLVVDKRGSVLVVRESQTREG